MRKIFLLLWLCISTAAIVNAQSINGKVVNKQSEPLVGAIIKLKNTYKYYVSDSEGKFKIDKLKAGTYSLELSFIGYDNLVRNVKISNQNIDLQIIMKESDNLTDEVVISALRAGRNTPVTSSKIEKSEISENNMGRDVPYLLELMPSVTTTSDAGAGVGYSKMSIRGTDISRINITVNGIPLNDAESHGVWWVDLPDISSSMQSIQVQRGVGTSTNGTSAFGANINILTDKLQKKAYSELSASYGTFNTYKANIKAGTGLINNHLAFDVRLSKIHSDGYIDRARTDMESFMVSGTYTDKKTLVKLNVISGIEDTYQAWGGVPKEYLKTNRTYNEYTYDNEIDYYKQSHYQLFISRELNKYMNLNLGFNYTKGKGYYEQYKEGKKLKNYGLNDIIIGNDTIKKTDLIQRKWLDNDLYVATYSVDYKNDNIKAIFGGSLQKYFGKHYGEIIWAKYASNSKIREQWYYNTGDKKELNVYGKFEYLMFDVLNVYADIQFRAIDYKIAGIDDDGVDISQDHNYQFFNPKFGLNYNMFSNQNVYFTFGVANREPARSDLKDRINEKAPVHETLFDYELGYTIAMQKAKFNLNLYYMDYKDQLVKTGKVNNVGNPLMENVPESYRAGIELVAGVQLLSNLNWQVNATLSQNKIKNYTEYVENWQTKGYNENKIGTSNISFSPEIIASSKLTYEPIKGLKASFISKYVGEQYIDNSSSKDRMLDAYFVSNMQFNYSFKTKFAKRIELQFAINNIFNEEYESNAWFYQYYDTKGKYNNSFGYFPQAGTNVMGGIIIGF